jgi:hypothetical protein
MGERNRESKEKNDGAEQLPKLKESRTLKIYSLT